MTLTESLPRRHLGLLLAISSVGLALHLISSGRYGYFRDEFYYLACSRHLDWGYVDHPPLIALIVFLIRKTLGTSLPALRLPPALAESALIVTTGLIARRLGGGRYAQGLAALSALIAPVFLSGGTILTMNPFDQLLWTVASYLLVRILAEERPALWVWLGVVAGIGLMNKHSLGFYLGATFVALLLTPERRLLRSPWPWIGAMLAGLILAPNLLWQVQHHWPTLEFLKNATAQKNTPVSPGEFLVQQILMINPPNALLCTLGLWFYVFSRRGARWRPLGWTFLLLLAFFMATRAKNYYFAPGYPVILAAGAVAAGSWLEAQRRRILKPVLVGYLIVVSWVPVPVVVPVLPVESFIRYTRRLGIDERPSERHRMGPLRQDYADMFGWEEMVAKIAMVYHALTPQEQAHCLIYAGNYGEAGAIDFFGPRYGLPLAASGHNSYFLWGPPPGRGEVAITIGQDPEDVEKAYRSVVEEDRTDNRYCMPYENLNAILVGRGLKMDLRTIWPRCKSYI